MPRRSTRNPSRMCRLCGTALVREPGVVRGVGAKCWNRLLLWWAEEYGDARPNERVPQPLTCSESELDELIAMVRDCGSFDNDGISRDWLVRTHVRYVDVASAASYQLGISVNSAKNRITLAMGGDRALGRALAPHWAPTYYYRNRWLPKSCLAHLDDLAKT